MNKVETVLAILDLKVGEEFRLRNNNTKDILVGSYFVDETGQLMWSDDETSCLPFSYLINGQYEIIKKPWRPLLGEGFYVVYPDGWVKYYIDYTPYTSLVSWFADKTNNIFKTQEEAMQARQRVMQDVYGKVM